jgi:hypothetical protein
MFVLESALIWGSVGVPQNLYNYIIIFNCIAKLLPVHVFNFLYKANVMFISSVTNVCLVSMHTAQYHIHTIEMHKILFYEKEIIPYYLRDFAGQILML